MSTHTAVLDGNEAAARVAYRLSEVIAIYPITPASPMGELADAWASQGQPNLFGVIPDVVEMQSEGGAAGAIHGALQAGALATTFTASQGLLLMIPNMFKIAGELTPAVIHVAARAIATHALSIFGDHSDVMAARSTGWAMLCSNSVQEAHDMSLIAHAATLRCRVPVVHFFDGFRTSHEINRLELLDDATIRAFAPEDLIRAHRDRALNPDRPVLRGSAQNPDVFFQAREASNPFYDATPRIVQQTMDEFAERVGRRYQLFEYVGHPEAERVLVMMGSGCGAAEEAVERLSQEGERVGLCKVRLFRPFDVTKLIAALPATTADIVVLDRTKEPGAVGEPLYQDVVTALAEQWPRAAGAVPRVMGGRFGLSSKEFTPAMVKAALDEAAAAAPRRHFTVGIVDDVTRLSIAWDPTFQTEDKQGLRAIFFGLGSDGTVSANKASAKIVSDLTGLYTQAYFVYDSKKSGSTTVSHVRFSRRPIRSSYLIQQADFIACHQPQFLDRLDVLERAADGATFLLNAPWAADDLWRHVPREAQEQILAKRIKVHVVDAAGVAREAGLGGRINVVMQTCFLKLSGLLPPEEAIEAVRASARKAYAHRGEAVLRRNMVAIDNALAALSEAPALTEIVESPRRSPVLPPDSPDFLTRVTGVIMAGRGDLLPVSALPVDGTFPTGTARIEKRGIAHEIPIWDRDICVECNLCALVCPHAAIRAKLFEPSALADAPDDFDIRPCREREWVGKSLRIQVAPDDCTGCGMCVEMCPAHSKSAVNHKAINMRPRDQHVDRERRNFDYFLATAEAEVNGTSVSVKTSQVRLPLFEFSGACAGCGETPYLKLITQLFGDRMIIANATGCSSIYGGNLPTTPWTTDANGRGPAWSNSLFEDNAEFGLGMRLAVDVQRRLAATLLQRLAPRIGDDLVTALLSAELRTDAGLRERRDAVAALKRRLGTINTPESQALLAVADALVRRSVWLIGGDGWAYDIGFGGLDHVLTTGRDVNILVLDTEVYSNTGGQASKSTPRAAVAKFASAGKNVSKKDLGLLAMMYGNVYVAQIAMGANPQQTVQRLLEAESYPGPSLVLAYSHCIAHGIDMSKAMGRQKDAVTSGYWPLFHYDPRKAQADSHALRLDSRKPTIPFKKFAEQEARFAMLRLSDPDRADRLFELAQRDIDERWRLYEQMVGVARGMPDGPADGEVAGDS